MDTLRTAIQSITVAALVVAAAQAYLILNKLWIRKHEKAVAESVSLAGESLGLVTLVVLGLSSAAHGYWAGFADAAIWVLAGMVTLAVGTGRWVEGRRQRGLWMLIRESLRLERSEVGDLARSFFRPSAARQILEILGQVALLDRELDDRERAFVESFAEAWGVEFRWDELTAGGSAADMVRLRQSVERYLATSPPDRQVSQLADTLAALVRVDEVTSAEEQLMLDELRGMLHHYVGERGEGGRHVVAVVPQDAAQDTALGSLLPEVAKQKLQGGIAYPVGPFFSAPYANLVAEEYRAMNFFATVVAAPSDAGATAPPTMAASPTTREPR